MLWVDGDHIMQAVTIDSRFCGIYLQTCVQRDFARNSPASPLARREIPGLHGVASQIILKLHMGPIVFRNGGG